MNNLISQIENHSNNTPEIYRRVIYMPKQTPFLNKISTYYLLILGFFSFNVCNLNLHP